VAPLGDCALIQREHTDQVFGTAGVFAMVCPSSTPPIGRVGSLFTFHEIVIPIHVMLHASFLDNNAPQWTQATTILNEHAAIIGFSRRIADKGGR
jgi:hypothetical protein